MPVAKTTTSTSSDGAVGELHARRPRRRRPAPAGRRRRSSAHRRRPGRSMIRRSASPPAASTCCGIRRSANSTTVVVDAHLGERAGGLEAEQAAADDGAAQAVAAADSAVDPALERLHVVDACGRRRRPGRSSRSPAGRTRRSRWPAPARRSRPSRSADRDRARLGVDRVTCVPRCAAATPARSHEPGLRAAGPRGARPAKYDVRPTRSYGACGSSVKTSTSQAPRSPSAVATRAWTSRCATMPPPTTTRRCGGAGTSQWAWPARAWSPS